MGRWTSAGPRPRAARLERRQRPPSCVGAPVCARRQGQARLRHKHAQPRLQWLVSGVLAGVRGMRLLLLLRVCGGRDQVFISAWRRACPCTALGVWKPVVFDFLFVFVGVRYYWSSDTGEFFIFTKCTANLLQFLEKEEDEAA